jgi:hypothetical protein
MAAALTLSGCTTDSQPKHPGGLSRASRSVPLNCGDYIGTHPPVPGRKVVLGVVALPTSSAGPALRTARTADPSLPRLFAKTGLLIKSGTYFEIVVAARADDRLGIGWGSAATPGKAVVVRNRSDVGLPGRWIAYAGGYWLQHPACVTLRVRTATQAQSVHLGLANHAPDRLLHPSHLLRRWRRGVRSCRWLGVRPSLAGFTLPGLRSLRARPASLLVSKRSHGPNRALRLRACIASAGRRSVPAMIGTAGP